MGLVARRDTSVRLSRAPPSRPPQVCDWEALDENAQDPDRQRAHATGGSARRVLWCAWRTGGSCADGCSRPLTHTNRAMQRKRSTRSRTVTSRTTRTPSRTHGNAWTRVRRLARGRGTRRRAEACTRARAHGMATARLTRETDASTCSPVSQETSATPERARALSECVFSHRAQVRSLKWT